MNRKIRDNNQEIQIQNPAKHLQQLQQENNSPKNENTARRIASPVLPSTP